MNGFPSLLFALFVLLAATFSIGLRVWLWLRARMLGARIGLFQVIGLSLAHRISDLSVLRALVLARKLEVEVTPEELAMHSMAGSNPTQVVQALARRRDSENDDAVGNDSLDLDLTRMRTAETEAQRAELMRLKGDAVALFQPSRMIAFGGIFVLFSLLMCAAGAASATRAILVDSARSVGTWERQAHWRGARPC